MKRAIRTALVLAILSCYVACQKEVSDTIPVETPSPTDSTGTDSTITPLPADSLVIISFSPDSGRVGTEVRIVGSGFDTVVENNLVYINNTAATVVSATKTVMTVQVLAGSTTGKISVATSGKIARSVTDFIVIKDTSAIDSTATNKNAWMRKTDPPPVGNTFIQGFSISGKGYLFMGRGLAQFDPVTNTWASKKRLPSNTSHTYGFCFVIGTKAYVGLGANYEGEGFYDTANTRKYNYREVWMYDAVADSWTKKRDFPGAPRVMPFSFATNGIGYVGCGDSTSGNVDFIQDFWKYDPAADSWTRLRDFPKQEAVGFSGFSLADGGYVLEGGPGNPSAPVSGPYSEVLWKYNAANDSWQKRAPLPVRDFVSAVVFSIGNKAYAALGRFYDGDTPPAAREDFWEYDPAQNTWTKKADTGGGQRLLSTGFAAGGKGYIGLGTGDYYEELMNDFWEYTPE